MLSAEENAYLTRVGPGSPMGELFRRFWMPALLSSEAVADGPPVRLRLLGENLLGFRDTSGRVGIIEPQCAHRLASLFFGRNEQSGLRCPYHGWKYGVDGQCVDTPNEPENSRMRERIKLRSYPTREQAGVVWVYMGPPECSPLELPQMHWVTAPAGYQHVSKWLQSTNWAQGLEGEIDSSHVSFLHSTNEKYSAGFHFPYPTLPPEVAEFRAQHKGPVDGAPVLTVKKTDYGMTYGARRHRNDEFHWRVTHWLLPTYSLIPQAMNLGTNGRCWVPIDDEHTWTFGYISRYDRPYTGEEIAVIEEGAAFPPRLTRGTYRLRDGYLIDTSLPVASADNDYLIDRDMQQRTNMTGIWGFNEQDRSVQESMGATVDRSREHLGKADMAVIAARRTLLQLARRLEAGTEPEIAGRAEAYNVAALDVATGIGTLDELLEAYAMQLGGIGG